MDEMENRRAECYLLGSVLKSGVVDFEIVNQCSEYINQEALSF